MRFRLASIALACAGVIAACTTDPPTGGGIFGDRPIAPSEEDDASVPDASTDAKPRDAGTDRGPAPSDAADD